MPQTPHRARSRCLLATLAATLVAGSAAATAATDAGAAPRTVPHEVITYVRLPVRIPGYRVSVVVPQLGGGGVVRARANRSLRASVESLVATTRVTAIAGARGAPRGAEGIFRVLRYPPFVSSSPTLVDALLPVEFAYPNRAVVRTYARDAVELPSGDGVSLFGVLFNHHRAALHAVAGTIRDEVLHEHPSPNRCVTELRADGLSSSTVWQSARFWEQAIEGSETVALLHRGLEVGFDEGVVGDDACGLASFRVPYGAFEDLLGPRGRALVGSFSDVARAGLGDNDPACNHGNGFTYELPRGFVADEASTVTSTGVTLVGVDGVSLSSYVYAEAWPYTIVAVTPACTLDRSFGHDGIVRPRLLDGRTSDDAITALVAGLDGRWFVAAEGSHAWWLGEFNADGTPDRSFGHRGWASFLPPDNESGFTFTFGGTGAEQEPDGSILWWGTNFSSHAGERSLVVKLEPSGALDTSFGDHGHVHVLGQMAGISDVDVQPDGSLVAVGGVYGGGCGDDVVEWLSPRGVAENDRTASFDRTHSFALRWGFSGGDFAVDADGGIGFAGTNYSCYGRSPPPTSFIEALTASGSLDTGFGADGITAFSVPDHAVVVGATRLLDGDVMVESTSTSSLILQDFSPTGVLLSSFGGPRGRVRIALPTNQSFYAYPTPVAEGPRGDADLVVPSLRAVTVEERIG